MNCFTCRLRPTAHNLIVFTSSDTQISSCSGSFSPLISRFLRKHLFAGLSRRFPNHFHVFPRFRSKPFPTCGAATGLGRIKCGAAGRKTLSQMLTWRCGFSCGLQVDCWGLFFFPLHPRHLPVERASACHQQLAFSSAA